MKLIANKKNAVKKTEIAVGNVVRLRFDNFDGRTSDTVYFNATVTKVNRKTFDALTEEGNEYRVYINMVGVDYVK